MTRVAVICVMYLVAGASAVVRWAICDYSASQITLTVLVVGCCVLNATIYGWEWIKENKG